MAPKGDYVLDYTFAPKKTLEAIAEEYGTPLFVYDRDTLVTRHKQVCEAFSWNEGFRQFFPVSAMDHPSILRVLREAGSGLLCSSASELHMAALAGAKGPELLFHACFPPYQDWEMAIESGATIILDHEDQLEELSREQYGDRVLGLRFCADQNPMISGQVRTKGFSKSGMPEDELLRVAVRAAERGFQKFGLYLMASSNVFQSGYYEAVAKVLLKLVPLVQSATGGRVCWCNLGGGLCWDTRQEYTLDIYREALCVHNIWKRMSASQPGLEDMALYTELGRYIAMPAGILLTRVRGIKYHDRSTVGLDASVSHLPRAAASYTHYHVSALGRYKQEDRETVHLTGPTPDGADIFEGRYILPPLEVGDILVFHGAGAYGQTLASDYRGVLRCPEVLLDKEGPRLISRRETIADRTIFLQGDHEQEQENQKTCTQAK